jgi:hypothetical protein
MHHGSEIPVIFRSRVIESYYLRSTAERPPLRIGVLVDGTNLISPFAAVLDQIRRSNFARIELILRNGLEEPRSGPRKSLPQRVIGLIADPVRRAKLGYGIYARWDGKQFAEATEMLSVLDCTELFAGIEQITVQPIVKGFVHRFPEQVVRTVRERDLDVLLRFGFNIIRGDILGSARYGMWSYHHGDNDFYRGGPSHFWEVYEDNPCSGVVLQVLNEELDNGLILDKAIASTDSSYSQAKNRIRPYLLGSQMMIRALHDVHEHGWEFVRGRAFSSREYHGQRKIYRIPTNADMCRFAVSRITSAVSRRVKGRGRKHHWRIASRRVRPGDNLPPDIDDFTWIESPRDHFYADPFLLSRAGRVWVFFEDYLYGEARGRLSCAELMPDGALGEVTPVLDHGRHLSYPFVFDYAGETFMIPESACDESVDLYRAKDFPHSWIKEKMLLPVAALDTTICQHDGKVWLFTTVVDPPRADNRLFLFEADNLFGEWRFHPANPISADVRTARNAGAIFSMGEQLIRPAQDCSVRYGYALHFQKIIKLTPREYAETRVHSLLPPESNGIFGIHTYARGGGFELIDGTTLRRV